MYLLYLLRPIAAAGTANTYLSLFPAPQAQEEAW